jgi:hypothetical protein
MAETGAGARRAPTPQRAVEDLATKKWAVLEEISMAETKNDTRRAFHEQNHSRRSERLGSLTRSQFCRRRLHNGAGWYVYS